MSRLVQITNRLRNRKSLIIIAVVLLVLNLFRLMYDHFDQKEEDISSRIALLDQYRMTIRDLDQMREKVSWLETQAKEIDSFLLSGPSEEKIVSDMQINIQEQISLSGLAVESLRPVRSRSEKQKTKDKEENFGEVALNIRLSGTLNQFVAFLGQLYSSKTLYQIESFTLKPYKNKEMKIFLDFKGYYKLTA
jgi:hypothetical protein